jgi:Protein of unknown function (DUF3572)
MNPVIYHSIFEQDAARVRGFMTRRQEDRRFDPRLQEETARALAIEALQFIAQDPERLGRFLSLSGIEPQSIREAAREPGFLLGVIEHLLGDESLLLAFANQNEIDPGDLRRARDVLASQHGNPG